MFNHYYVDVFCLHVMGLRGGVCECCGFTGDKLWDYWEQSPEGAWGFEMSPLEHQPALHDMNLTSDDMVRQAARLEKKDTFAHGQL